jgi:putative membrane protein
LALTLACFTACTRENGVEASGGDRPPAATPAEQDFMMKAAQAHRGVVEGARIALNKAENSDVRDFANMIESDHTHAIEDLADLMKGKNMNHPDSVAPEAEQDIARMNGLSGAEFDREFVNMMVMDHQKTVGMYRDIQGIAQDADVRQYVEDLLPELEMHLEKAQRLQSKLFSAPARS